ncbi:AB hydrolase-1 domain-containing protein [Haematococcus lacustris]|uniref:AB hydrolase-1 domain-containing protein n=1 Tax=Haematococcus lacustris TaxID=44745 RepID=A0A699YDU2_HAELA|nr:AB hydrolase-1 domain-containing protein [Haematococcus lacustris]
MCLLGFGWSQKALVDYTNGKQWIRQISSFIEEVVASGPVVLAGNSLGGYASLAAAVARPDLVRGVAMLNGAGPFDEPGRPALDPDQPEPLVDRFKNWLAGIGKRVVLYFAFVRAKQPERIKEVLNMVYTNRDMVDDELVDSIVQPALDPLAAEVFFRINHRTAPPVTLNRLLTRLQAPLLLLWGMRDPWITPSKV